MHENCDTSFEENQDKYESLNWVLKQLVDNNLSEDMRKEMKRRLQQVYTQGFRHQYSFITGYLLQLLREDENLNLSEVAANLEMCSPYLMEDCAQDEAYCNGIRKFIDHVSLEASRLDYIKGMYRPTVNDLKAISGEISGLDASLKNQQRETEGLNKSLENQKMDFIAILGIFSGIVLAFVGGITFSNSALQGIAGVTIYRLIAISTICGMVLVDTIAVAMMYISKIVFRKPQKWGLSEWLVVGVNGVFLLILFATSVVYYISF